MSNSYIYMKPLAMKLLLHLLVFCATATIFAQQEANIYDKFESKFYTIDGYKINVEVKGTGDPIFFLPGVPRNSHDYLQGNFGQYFKLFTTFINEK